MSFLGDDNLKIAIKVLIFCIVILICLIGFDYLKKDKIIIVKENLTEEIEKNPVPKLETQELLGKAELSYAGGTEGRHKNIELGIARINGKVLEPGEEFSFKKALGTVTIDEGFSEERIFLNGEVKKGVGGGLCQVSTLIFRAAMSSALPITERANHSYTVSYYDFGLDATYSEPGPDVKFVNDTAHPITIKGKTKDLVATFEIYGVSDGRVASTSEVEISNLRNVPPTKYVWVPELEEGQDECINTPQIGFTAKIKYYIIYASGEIKEKEFVSNYKPLQRICFIVGDKINSFDIKKAFNL